MRKTTFLKLFFLALCAILINSSTIAQNITVNLNNEKQTIRGFGGMTQPRWYNNDLTDEQLDIAFGNGPEQLGLSILRLHIDPETTQWYKNLSNAQRAINNHGAIIFASPWTPPIHMKTNNLKKGGRLKTDMYGAYANHLKDYYDYMNAQGVPLYAISVQNEPDWTTHDSCEWTPLEMKNFLDNNASIIPTRVMGPETIHAKDSYQNVVESSPELDILATHGYGGPANRHLTTNKEQWMTEHFTPNSEQYSGDRWPEALLVGEEINEYMVDGYNAYVWWYIAKHYGLVDKVDNNPTPTKRGYVMGHYSKFVRPGAVRLDATDLTTNGVITSAYKSGNSLVIVAINNNNSSKNIELDLFGNQVKSVTKYETTSSSNINNVGTLTLTDGTSISNTLAAYSITTFVGEIGANVTPDLVCAATASNSSNGNVIENTLDGDLNTFWSSYNLGVEAVFDLCGIYNVTSLNIAWRNGNLRAANFKIEVSTDNLTWTNVFDGQSSGTSLALENIDIPNSNARYVKYIGSGNNTGSTGNNWTTVSELEIQRGEPDLICDVTATSQYNSSVIENTLDGDFDTRWSSYVNGVEAVFDLCKISNVTSLNIAWRKGNERRANFEIEVSTDNLTWTHVLAGQSNGTSLALENIDIPDSTARYIKYIGLGNYDNNSGVLNNLTSISEFKIQAGNANLVTNLALNKNTTQSSTYNTAISSKAVDGNTDGIYANGSVTRTVDESEPWWEVDLGVVANIKDIKVYNRTDFHTNRLTNYHVFVSDVAFTSNTVSGSKGQSGVGNFHENVDDDGEDDGEAGFPSTVSINRTGRYVRIQLSGTNPLNLTEVEVLGVISNLAFGQTATQSSTYNTAIASKALDGNTDGSYSNGSVTHTTTESQPWWEVDLGAIATIANINIYNRTNCACSDRLTNYHIFVSDDPFTSSTVSGTQMQTGVGDFYKSAEAGSPTSRNINRTGRYVRIQLEGNTPLSLAEVEISGILGVSDISAKTAVKKPALEEPDTAKKVSEDLFLYPNPVQNNLYIRNISNGDTIRIYNLLGVLVKETKYENYLDVSYLSDGPYLLTTIKNDKKQTAYFIKK